MDKKIILADNMRIPQYIIKSSLENIGLKLYSYWILKDGYISSPADITIHIAYIINGHGYYDDLKVKAGDVLIYGLNEYPIHMKVHEISMFIIDMDFTFFYSITGLKPCICQNSIFLDKENPFYHLGQVLFQCSVQSWIPKIETYIHYIFERHRFPIKSNAIERVVIAAREIVMERDFRSIADDMSVSYRQLQRDFNSILGISLIEYRNINRFYKAARSLKKNSITEAAHNAGYYDQAHMNREFKKKSGWTPKQVSIYHYY